MRELYDHRADTSLYDVDSFENDNVAGDPAHRIALVNLSVALRNTFSESC
jgi:hypothetical protein